MRQRDRTKIQGDPLSPTDPLEEPMEWPSHTKRYIIDLVQIAGIEIPASDVKGLYNTASTINGLGSPIHGAPRMLRIGSTPYEFIQFIYDEVYGKWVSTSFIQGFQTAPDSDVTATTYTDTDDTLFPPFYVPNFKEIYDAGCRPQCLFSANLNSRYSASSGTSRAYAQVGLYEFADGDTPPATTLVAHGGEVTVDATVLGAGVTDYKASGWSEMTIDAAPTKAHAIVHPQQKVATISGTPNGRHSELDSASILIRWVADPV